MSNHPPILTPDQRLRVFVSSTLRELAPEREAARRAVERLRLAPVMFELGARPHPPRELYRAYLEQSHVFVGVYWESYGWVAPGESVSGLEDEYDLSGQRPKLIYVKSPAPRREERLKGLLARIRGDDRVSYKSFSSPRELGRLLEGDLALLLTESFEASEVRPVDPPPAEEPVQLAGLPAQPTPIVGRDDELAAIRALLEDESVRLVTLAGPGGTGKTRLAVEATRRLREGFADGVCYVPLATVADPDLFLPAVAQALGLRDVVGQSVADSLEAFLRDRRILLVLDNFEQILPAATKVADLLGRSPGLKVLVTSRAVLRLSGEREFPVPPLSVPDPGGTPPLDALSEYEAVRLFVQRARAALPSFALTAENAAAVAEICRRVDGLPLAIELAAARVRLLPPRAMLTRFDDPLKFLTGGARDLPSRQQTLRNTIQWSYGLLSDTERTVFERLGVFAGGCTLEAAEAVCSGGGIDVLEGLESLVEKSLLWQDEADGEEPRFAMLHIIREFALEKLQESRGADEIGRLHADYYLEMAEDAAPHLGGERALEWLSRLEREHDNLRAALAWRFGRTGADLEGSAEILLRFAGALWRFWYIRGHWSEGRTWLERALAATSGATSARRARVLASAALIALFQGDYTAATAWLDESLALFRALDDADGAAVALTYLGYVAAFRQDLEAAQRLREEATALRPRLTDPITIGYLLIFLGLVAATEGDLEGTQTLHEEGLALFREAGDRQGIVWCLTNLGLIAVAQGDPERATALLRENLILARRIGDQQSAQYSYLGLANLALAQGQAERAVRLWGAAEAARDASGLHLHDLARMRTGYDDAVAAARDHLGSATFESLWAEGRRMARDAAARYALEDVGATPAGPDPAAARASRTER